MKQYEKAKFKLGIFGLPSVAVAVALSAMAAYAPSARAQTGNDALKVLKGMSDYVANQNAITVTYDSDVAVITSELQKFQFTSSGQVQLSRPDKLRATRTGGYADVELVFDGKMLTINNKGKMRSPKSTRQARLISLSIRRGTSMQSQHQVPISCFPDLSKT